MPDENLQENRVEILTEDGKRLGATYFANSKTPARAVLIAGATAVRQHFYAKFAKYLAENDCAVLTFDYRGIGESKPRTGLKNFQSNLIDWGRADSPACLNWLSDKHPGIPVHLVGHSAGGNFIGLMPNAGIIHSAFLVSSSSGYVPRLLPQSQLKAHFVFRIYEPICSLVFGYVPGKKIGLGEDLPTGVVKQWAHWCLNRGYVENSFGKEIETHLYNELTLPVLAVTPVDDEIATDFNVADFMRLLPQAKIEYRNLEPAQFNLPAIGHLNFFRSQSKAMWSIAPEWFSKSESATDRKPE